MATQNIQAHSGNLITIEFDGKRFGTIQRLQMQDDYSPEPLSGIGSINVLENVPSMARHVLTVEYAVLKSESLRSAGLLSENGDARLCGMEFDIVIYAKMPSCGDGGADSLQEVRKYRYCSYASGSVTIQSHRTIMSDATFNAREVVGTGL